MSLKYFYEPIHGKRMAPKAKLTRCHNMTIFGQGEFSSEIQIDVTHKRFVNWRDIEYRKYSSRLSQEISQRVYGQKLGRIHFGENHELKPKNKKLWSSNELKTLILRQRALYLGKGLQNILAT